MVTRRTRKVLPSSTEDRCRRAREDGAGVRVQGLGRGPSRDEGGRTPGRPVRRPLGSLEGAGSSVVRGPALVTQPGEGDAHRTGRKCPHLGEDCPQE